MEYQNKRGGRVKLVSIKVSPARAGVDERSTQDVLSFPRCICIWVIWRLDFVSLPCFSKTSFYVVLFLNPTQQSIFVMETTEWSVPFVTLSTQRLTMLLVSCFVLVLYRNLAKIIGAQVWMPWKMLWSWKDTFISHCWTYTIRQITTLRYRAIMVFYMSSIHLTLTITYIPSLPPLPAFLPPPPSFLFFPSF